MKKTAYTFLFFCSLFFSHPGRAQTWFPDNATWHYTMVYVTSPYYGPAEMKITGDTLINGIQAKKLSVTASCDFKSEIVYEDSSRVYYWSDDDSVFSLLYDFNLVAGDTLVVNWKNEFYDETSYYLLDSVSTIQLNAVTARIQYLTLIAPYAWWNQAYSANVIIEYLGHFRYFFPNRLGFCDMSNHSFLRCYEDSTIGLYQTGAAPDCLYSNTSIDEKVDETFFSIAPNPSNGNFEIMFDVEHADRRLVIFNTMGKKMFETPCNRVRQPIALPLPKGTYIAEINTGEKRMSKKLLIY